MYTANEYLRGGLKLILGEIIVRLVVVPLISVIVRYRFREHQYSIRRPLPADFKTSAMSDAAFFLLSRAKLTCVYRRAASETEPSASLARLQLKTSHLLICGPRQP